MTHSVKTSSKTIPLFTIEANIKRRLRRHLKNLGFTKDENGQLQPPELNKDTIRAMHSAQRISRLKAESDFIKRKWPILNKHFANGNEITPERISPRLELINGDTWQSDVFRMAALTWSVPVSQGYGRRMRFLVWDDYNDKLIGLLALGDPVFNLRARDEWIGWTLAQKKSHLVNVMDAYVLGALPPYNMLLGGKLVASLVCTREVRDSFSLRYANSQGIISKEKKSAQLCLVTTTSALGRSSLYNRLTLNGAKIFEPIGYTSGWGHFHIPDELFVLIREYLEERGDDYAHNHHFGEGPNWRLRAIRKALTLIGMPSDILQHGIGRQLFVCSMAQNAKSVLNEKAIRARYTGLQCVADVGELVKERWIVPRAKRMPEFTTWDSSHILLMLSEKPKLHFFNNDKALEGKGDCKNDTRSF